MGYQYVIYEKKDRIAYVTLNRPEVFNALHPPANEELSRIFADFRDDPNVWVAILTGTGDRAFCAGNDLKYTAAHPEMLTTGAKEIPGGFGGITDRFDCNKPIIAALNGFALGGGLELALASDIVVAAEHAKLGLPEPKVGLVAGAGGIHRLPRQVPLKIAMEMLLTAKHITAQEAYRVGLVNRVVPLSELAATAQALAEEVVACAPICVQMSKRAALEGLGLPLNLAVERGHKELMNVFNSEDAVEGPRAFAEKRKPVWKGR